MNGSRMSLKLKLVNPDKEKATNCPCCDSTDVSQEKIKQEFEYGVGKQKTTLYADVVHYVCNACEFEFLDDSSEDARTEAVCRHLGLLTPNEIRNIRKSAGLSRSDFSKLTGIGTASLARWESGQSLQSLANDKYLRLLSCDYCRSLLVNSSRKNIDQKLHPKPLRPRQFRVLTPTDDDIRKSDAFSLREVV